MRYKIKKLGVVFVLLTVLALLGEIQCVWKMFKCNWEPVGKAEILYTVGTFTGLGSVIGYFNIEDK